LLIDVIILFAKLVAKCSDIFKAATEVAEEIRKKRNIKPVILIPFFVFVKRSLINPTIVDNAARAVPTRRPQNKKKFWDIAPHIIAEQTINIQIFLAIKLDNLVPLNFPIMKKQNIVKPTPNININKKIENNFIR
jgi:hypothetical protein